jgi:non-ribosomal peptide synthase protein (TIGR01720 family)
MLISSQVQAVLEEELSLDGVGGTRDETEVHFSDPTSRDLLSPDLHQVYNTEVLDLLLAALALTLGPSWVTLEGHGREGEGCDLDLSRTVGWFTTMFPFLLSPGADVGETVIGVKEGLRKVPEKGLSFGLHFPYDFQSTLPRTTFNYLGRFEGRGGEWEILEEGAGEVIGRGNELPWDTSLDLRLSQGRAFLKVASRTGGESQRLAQAFQTSLEQVLTHLRALKLEGTSTLTPSDVRYVVGGEALARIQSGGRPIQSLHLANSLQKGFIFRSLGGRDPYTVQHLLSYKEELDLGRYKEAWAGVVGKYPSLRLRFDWEGPLVQVVDRKGGFEWSVVLTRTSVEREEGVKERLRVDRERAFDLGAGHLLRLYIFPGTSDTLVLISFHHAILDGWSMPILFRTLHELYVRGRVESEGEVEGAYVFVQDYSAKHRTLHTEYFTQGSFPLLQQLCSTWELVSLEKVACEKVLSKEFRRKRSLEKVPSK